MKRTSSTIRALQMLDERDARYRVLAERLREEARPEQKHEGEWPLRVRQLMTDAADAIDVLVGPESVGFPK